MLQLKDITKVYETGDSTVHALRGVSLNFRESEFVSILGQSGCGKTTLLNIIGGLDQYTNGDLIINGKSTKKFSDRDWDSYRNHSIGFIFQSYNLIPHQTVLSNVELALTLSGVSKKERRQRAIEALNTVGLGDQINKKPNQMSGGQMQRVAIARALVNNPDILLADEPTGALDSETSVQIMEILKNISKNKLVIMVTHNPELAKEYSTRIINLLDGNVVSDSNPVSNALSDKRKTVLVKPNSKEKRVVVKKQKTSMSFFTALALSLNNLLTKKGRTFLTSFAGSIGIIGIALILSVSTGVNSYIASVENDTMSSFPIQINESSMDAMSMFEVIMSNSQRQEDEIDQDKIYSNNIMTDVMLAFSTGLTKNNLEKLKEYIESNSTIKDNATDIKYIYNANLNAFTIIKNSTGEVVGSFENLSGLSELMTQIGLGSMSDSMSAMDMMGTAAWTELVGSLDHIKTQYELIDGRFPTKEGETSEVVLIVDQYHQVTDFILYTLGIRNIQELRNWVADQMNPDIADKDKTKFESPEFSTSELLGYEFMVLPDSERFYLGENGEILERDNLSQFVISEGSTAKKVKIVGIVTPTNKDSITIGSIGYTSALMNEIMFLSNNSPVIEAQKNNDKINLITGLPFEKVEPDMTGINTILAMNPQVGAYLDKMTTDQKILALKSGLGNNLTALLSTAPYGGFTSEHISAIRGATGFTFTRETDENLLKIANYMLDNLPQDKVLEHIGYIDLSKPSAVVIYPKDFDAKEAINNEIKNVYNGQQEDADKISYSDAAATLIGSITTIVDAITYVLIAFVSISLVVSSIMIGIITYISVLERTKEIGILRAIGASKKDISRVFNAETMIIGLTAGVIGIVATILLNEVINIILFSLTGLATLKAALDPMAAIILVLISMSLTLIAGLVPASMASKKDPVIALRTE